MLLLNVAASFCLSLWLPPIVASACYCYKYHFGTRLAGWLRQSPPPQEQENTEEMEPRETLSESRSAGSPEPKLQKQLQIHLYRLPDWVLKSGAQSVPWQSFRWLDQSVVQFHSAVSQLLTRPAMSQRSRHVTNSLLSTHPVTDSPQKPATLRMQHVPSMSHLHESVPSSHQQDPKSKPHSARTTVSSQICSQRSELKHPDTRLEINTKQTVCKAGPPPRLTFSSDAKERVQEELKEQPEEDNKDSSVKGTVLSCPTTDPQYVLRSQNPAECASVNTPTGITNGFPQRGLLQSKHKIRVDFKVSRCTRNWDYLSL